MENHPDIFSFIKSEESNFDTKQVQIGENWYWNFKKHVQLIFHLKNSIFYTGDNDWTRAFKNVLEPILSISYWTEDLEVKDVTFFFEDSFNKIWSFLLKKYHDEVYTRENDIDVLFDEITECDIDYGGVLVQKGLKRPEVIPLNTVAFCDQTDILGGVIGFKHNFSPAKLRSMSKAGWGDKKNGATINIEELIVLATSVKDSIGTQGQRRTNESTGKTIEIYIVRGNMPDGYLKDNDDMEYYCNQIQIVAFYLDKDSKRQGVVLYRKEDDGSSIKFFSSSPVFQRALGRGDGEKLLHSQIWTNFLTIHKMNMFEAGAKVPLVTDDPSYTQKNKIQEMENLEITVIEDGKTIRQVPTLAPANLQLLDKEINELYGYAQTIGAANDPLMGKEAPSGTTFRGQNQAVQLGRGSHDRRRGKRAKFIEEIYRDWIIPDIMSNIFGGKKFIASLSTEELNWISDTEATNTANQQIVEAVLKGKFISPEQQTAMTQTLKKLSLGKGNKQLIEILKGEYKDRDPKIGINIANKQKDLSQLSDKFLSIFTFIFQNPQGFMQAMQIPALAKSFESILEYGGLSIGDFSSLIQPMTPQSPQSPQTLQQTPQAPAQPSPVQPLTLGQPA